MAEDEDDRFIKDHPIIFKKYRVKKRIGEGAFGNVYLGQTISNNSLVAIKVEPRKIIKPLLESEAFLLYAIAGVGIPEVKSFGKMKNYNVLVEPLLGKSLFDIFAENHKEMSLVDACLIGKQVIDRIQWVHFKNIVHRDIKPDNFLIGLKDPNVIYLIDFGLSKKYRSSTTNKHIKFGFTGKLTGTVRFASINALRGGEQSRRDDIESIGYMMVYFLKKKLPWQGVTGNKKMERYLKIYKMKKNTPPEKLCEGLMPEMAEYISYAKKLEFEQEPDYNYLRKLFERMLKRVKNTNDILVFSWIKMTDVTNLKNPINPASRRDSPQGRIYQKIKKNLQNGVQSSDSDTKQGSFNQVYSQAVPPTDTKVVTSSANISEMEFESKTEKKISKKGLKNKEGLNTIVANLDVTFDEGGAVDFENETLKKGGKDTNEMNMHGSDNNIIIGDSSKNINKNLNIEFNKNSDINNINNEEEIKNDADLKQSKDNSKNKFQNNNKTTDNKIINSNLEIKNNLSNNISDNSNNILDNILNNNNTKDSSTKNLPTNKTENLNPINNSINNIQSNELNEDNKELPNIKNNSIYIGEEFTFNESPKTIHNLINKNNLNNVLKDNSKNQEINIQQIAKNNTNENQEKHILLKEKKPFDNEIKSENQNKDKIMNLTEYMKENVPQNINNNNNINYTQDKNIKNENIYSSQQNKTINNINIKLENNNMNNANINPKKLTIRKVIKRVKTQPKKISDLKKNNNNNIRIKNQKLDNKNINKHRNNQEIQNTNINYSYNYKFKTNNFIENLADGDINNIYNEKNNDLYDILHKEMNINIGNLKKRSSTGTLNKTLKLKSKLSLENKNNYQYQNAETQRKDLLDIKADKIREINRSFYNNMTNPNNESKLNREIFKVKSTKIFNPINPLLSNEINNEFFENKIYNPINNTDIVNLSQKNQTNKLKITKTQKRNNNHMNEVLVVKTNKNKTINDEKINTNLIPQDNDKVLSKNKINKKKVKINLTNINTKNLYGVNINSIKDINQDAPSDNINIINKDLKNIKYNNSSNKKVKISSTILHTTPINKNNPNGPNISQKKVYTNNKLVKKILTEKKQATSERYQQKNLIINPVYTKIKKMPKDGDIRTSRLIKSYQNSIVNSKILNSDNNFINNINNPNKLMNKQIINHSQINYQIPVFISNNNNIYNTQFLNTSSNFPIQTNISQPNPIQNPKFITIAPTSIQANLNQNFTQKNGIQYIQAIPNIYNSYNYSRYNSVQNANIYGYPKKYNVSLIRK